MLHPYNPPSCYHRITHPHEPSTYPTLMHHLHTLPSCYTRILSLMLHQHHHPDATPTYLTLMQHPHTSS
ncbi:hypothetical protein DPMN_011361 [Dreissena polymorpha]|uniref:Uncharacterized protein n=1 Tax=Dreissena polymorpha TaxID=45954 RepID=A0A9D4N1L5_DREPO|nr:hypothetical protein DPMN_011361 [Dreissena polymorpha]